MPPKKRNAEPEAGGETADTKSSGTNELRRSTRGGGHAAPEAAQSKPRSASNKKAKTTAPKSTSNGADKDSADADAARKDDSTTENAAGVTDEKLEAADKAAETTGDKDEATGVEVPQENKDAAKSTKRIEIGDSLPEGITLKDEQDKDVSISEIIKEKGAVFFVYPKVTCGEATAQSPAEISAQANTPGCTNQACLFRDSYAEFGPLGYEGVQSVFRLHMTQRLTSCLSVYGLSSDSPKTQANWKEKNNFPYPLLCDPAQLLLKLLGAAKGVKSNQRSHYIVAAGGKLVDAKYTVSPKDSANLALEFIKLQK